MFVAFFESIKYVGHLFPIAFLRVFIGYFYLNQAIEKYQSDFLSQPRLADSIAQGLSPSLSPVWYQDLLQQIVVPHWQTFSATLLTTEFVIGLSFLFGYLVRPVALIAVALSWFYLSVNPNQEVLFKTFIAIHVTLAWLGAGRCLGFDYYFYKRNRGIWW